MLVPVCKACLVHTASVLQHGQKRLLVVFWVTLGDDIVEQGIVPNTTKALAASKSPMTVVYELVQSRTATCSD